MNKNGKSALLTIVGILIVIIVVIGISLMVVKTKQDQAEKGKYEIQPTDKIVGKVRITCNTDDGKYAVEMEYTDNNKARLTTGDQYIFDNIFDGVLYIEGKKDVIHSKIYDYFESHDGYCSEKEIS